MVSANGTVVNNNVPGPQRDCVPLYFGCEPMFIPELSSGVARPCSPS
jgi:hypothetical protein